MDDDMRETSSHPYFRQLLSPHLHRIHARGAIQRVFEMPRRTRLSRGKQSPAVSRQDTLSRALRCARRAFDRPDDRTQPRHTIKPDTALTQPAAATQTDTAFSTASCPMMPVYA